MTRILDLGCGTNPHPLATETADAVDTDAADRVVDLECEWPYADASADGIILQHVLEHLSDPDHVFAEAARVLAPGGWLEITVPLGDDWHADPDHKQFWTYSTPAKYCQRRARHWDDPPPFVLASRDLSVWFFPPFSWLSPLLQAVAQRYPAEAAIRCSAGELTARYRRVSA